LDTICVGMGVAAEIASAPATRRCSRSLSQLLIGVLPCTSLNRTICLVADAAALDEASLAHNLGETHSSRQRLRLSLVKKSDHRHRRVLRPAASGQAAPTPLSSVMNWRRLRSSMGSSPEPAVPAYRRLRLPRKRPQVLGPDLNSSESGCRRPISASGQTRTAHGERLDPMLMDSSRREEAARRR
jgi:hypothetical protein